jgi:preprotein translocase subunit YajC
MSKMIAQTAAPQTAGLGPMGMLAFYALLAGAFYFFFIAPQRKKQKALEQMLASLQSGDEVMTTGGIYGTITNVKDDRFIVRISDTTKIEVGKGFITSVVKRAGGDEAKA